jgi:hypothetical protein
LTLVLAVLVQHREGSVAPEVAEMARVQLAVNPLLRSLH